MKRILKIIGSLLGFFLLIGIIGGGLAHEPLPLGNPGSGADALAHKMLDALDHEKYEDTRILQWSYRGGANSYKWDRKQGLCLVKWDDNEIVLNLANPTKSDVKVDGVPTSQKEKEELIQKAVKMFNNDSFWLVAPYKVFDKGTQRAVVKMENGSQGLLVTYNSGGSTPGDSYLWLLKEDGLPYAFKMWVKIIPIGGLEASWDDWLVTESGAYLPKTHQFGPLSLSMGNVKGFK
ncbi:hypothetical protein GTQ34_02935 [Muricauda sp. JGD-17]|uniref:Uncharacterized protein n=1 Tax=Flagellimonas ochracea TaxID=2696472 RepID=A0A964WWK1_9FLAO|nr:hypothetical protein [Allomuricauda ochracea]NAY90863.1 hypothetical protein [Allomuricauda ochracea]